MIKKDRNKYSMWYDMKRRCYDYTHKEYKNYGGKGVIVCQRWFNDFNSFKEDIGERPFTKWSLDRINSDGNYEPNNCRWASPNLQAYNQSKNNISLYTKRTKKHSYKIYNVCVRFNGEEFRKDFNIDILGEELALKLAEEELKKYKQYFESKIKDHWLPLKCNF